MLEFINLTKKYEDKIIVNNLNLKVGEGTVLGFLGPNGAGKTTTIKMCCGLVNPTSGDIKIFGDSILNSRKKYIKNVGAVLEGNRNIYWRLTPIENMEYFASIRGIYDKNLKNKMEYYLELFNLKEKRNCECGKLSRGMQQKVAICCSLISNSKILFLDEPTLGLDVESVLAMEEIIKEISSKDKIIFITSHDLHFINNLCERIVIINKGNLVWDDSIKNFNNRFNAVKYNIKVDEFNEDLEKKLNYLSLINSYKEEANKVLQFEMDNDNSIVNILNNLRENKINILGVTKEERSVEDLFMEIINTNKKGD